MNYYVKLILLLVVGTIALQGFQCSSREMTTAKVAMKNGDIPKALENLEKEIAKNPKNGEAYILLAELKMKQGDMPGAIALMNQAEPLVANTPTLKDRPSQFKFEMFRQAIQNGQEAFSRYNQNKNSKQLETAIKNYQTAVSLRPFFSEGYRRIGLANEILEKTDDAIAAYKEYIKVIQPSIDVATFNNIYVGAKTQNLTQKIGKSTFVRGSKLTNGDSTVLEKYTVEGKDLFMLSIVKQSTAPSEMQVVSWSYDPPQNILPGEREIVPDAISQPINSLGAIYYRKKEKDNSLNYFKMVSAIDPLNEDANSAIVTLYQELGKSDEAVNAIRENIRKDPTNPLFIAQLGDVYMNESEYDKAIEQYEAALKIKPDYYDVMRNLGGCYGNKAAKIQQEQINLVNSGTIKVPDTNQYYPLLRKSAEYFSQVIKTPTFSKDIDVWGDLCNIYMALQSEKSLFETTLTQFEALESGLPKEKLESYYFKLLKIYGQTKSSKYSEIESKISKLN